MTSIRLFATLMLVGCAATGPSPIDAGSDSKGAVDGATPTVDAWADASPADAGIADAPDAQPDGGAAPDLSACEAAAERTAFVGARVLPMTGAPPIEAATVVVGDGRVCAIIEGGAELPDGTELIDAAGRTLLPGLADMHVHLNVPEDLDLYLANGVTAVRVMWGTEWAVETRDRIEAGELQGPTLWTTGPITDGDPPYWPGSTVVATAQAAKDAVYAQAAAGYDGVKVYSKLEPVAYEAILDAAEEVGLPVVGHVPDAVGLESVLDRGGQVTMEHLLGYDMAVSDGSVEALTVQKGVANCPTLVVLDRYARVDELQAAPPAFMKYVHPGVRERWMTAEPYAPWTTAQLQDKVAELHALGAPLLVGTDTSNPFVAPGFSLHEELELLVGAGLPPEDVLRMATRDAAVALGRGDRAGTVEVGKDADLLLLDADPLADIASTRAIAGVMVKGRWLPAEELQDRIDALAERYDEDYGLDFECLPDGALTPPAGDHVVFRVAGPLAKFDAPGAWVAHDFDVVLDGEPVVVDSFSAMATADFSFGSNWVTVHAFSTYEPLEGGGSTYRYFAASIPTKDLQAALDAGSATVDGTHAVVTVNRMRLVPSGPETLVSMCPIGVTAAPPAPFLCAAPEQAFTVGSPVRLAMTAALTADPQKTGGDAACGCWKLSGGAVPCADVDAALGRP